MEKKVKLKEARKNAGLTQSEIAHAVGLSRVGYMNYEMGKRYPDVRTAIRIADVLKVGNLRKIWDGTPIPKV